jgi:hypothetical protein
MFDPRRFKRHDPKGLVPNHIEQVAYHWPYAHEKWEEESFTKDAQNWAQVLERKACHGLTVFKTHSLEKNMEVLTQGVIDKREVEEVSRVE